MPADVVYEDDHTLAFLDIKPLFQGHVLIVPKVHVETLWNVPDETLSHITKVTKRISVAVRDAMLAEGIFIANNNIISQSVPHFHIHVVPRNKKDGLKGFFWPREKYESDAHRTEVKEKIIKML